MKHPTLSIGLTDQEIIEGLRHRDSQLTRFYFYDTCRVAYHVCDKRYDLAHKPGLDFFSIAHEYYLALDKHNFHQLDDRKPGMSLRTWMVNGFRFVLLDRLKAYNRESRVATFEERMSQSQVGFDLPDDNFSADFRATVEEICSEYFARDSRSAIILKMLLVEGFKGKEVASQLGISPSAVAQRFHKLMTTIVVPYFKANYTAPIAMSCVEMADQSERPCLSSVSLFSNNPTMQSNHSNRITPSHITTLGPNEIFVFGSNLQGMHGGGAARAARLYFGAKMGVGVGPQGSSYAIPTMQGGPETIQPYVDEFVEYASQHPEQVFLVTPIGCGIAGFEPADIAPLFANAVGVDNIYLPKSFWDVLA